MTIVNKMTKYHLYSMRLDTPLTPVIKNQFVQFFKDLEVKYYIIGQTELKKDSGKPHFHVVSKISLSENKVRKEFKNYFNLLPCLQDSNGFSCAMKKKDKKCILLAPKKYK